MEIKIALSKLSDFITWVFDQGELDGAKLEEIEEVESTIEAYVSLKESEG